MNTTESLAGIYGFLGSKEAVGIFLASLLVFSAGCSGLLSDGGGADAATIDSVPDGVDGVMHFDSGVVEDQTTVTLMNGLLERGGEDQSYEEMLEEAEAESNLSRDDFNSATVFMKLEDLEQQEYAGMIVDTEWSWEELREASDDEVGEVEEDEYNGVTVYTETDEMDEEAWVADFGDGTFAFGTPDVVRDVIDTREGDASSFGGDLRTAYDNAEDGYMKSAFVVPEQEVDEAGDQAGVGTDFVPTPEIMTMTYFTDGDTMNVDAEMTMNSTEEAEQFYQVAGATLDPATDPPGDSQDPFTTLVDAISVDQDDETVEMSVSMTPETLLELLDQLGGTMGPGVGGTLSVGPSPAGIAG